MKIVDIIFISMSQQPKFTFKNLEPVNYLKTFNRMIDHQSRNVVDGHKSRLSVVALSKFPIHKDYENMEGIFENVNKKKVEDRLKKFSLEQQAEEKFIKKHNEFMRQVLQRCIEHNQSRQNTFQKQKEFYKGSLTDRTHLRSSSQPKLDKFKKQNKLKQKMSQISDAKKSTIGSDIVLSEDQKETHVEVLPKLQPRKKKEKIHFKKDKQIEEFIVNRKLTLNPESITSHKRSSEHLAKDNDDVNLDFKGKIVQLQLRQADKQTLFANKVDESINAFERKMNIQVHAINYYSFWKDPQINASREDKGQPIQQIEQLQQGRVDYKS